MNYYIHYRKRRRHSIALSIDALGKLQVSAPYGMSRQEVDALLLPHQKWIAQKTAEQEARVQAHPPAQYREEGQVFYLGKPYILQRLQKQRTSVTILSDHRLGIAVHAMSDGGTYQKILEKWYRKQALNYFNQRIAFWAEKVPWVHTLPKLKIRKMRRQWGNCTVSGCITLNWQLIKLPEKLIDAVILHELCHLQEHNHSKRFYALLSSISRNWQQDRRTLKNYAHSLYDDC